jgi:hypothetical protein
MSARFTRSISHGHLQPAPHLFERSEGFGTAAIPCVHRRFERIDELPDLCGAHFHLVEELLLSEIIAHDERSVGANATAGP